MLNDASVCSDRHNSWQLKAEHRPLWHLTGAAHVEGLDHSTEAIGCHRDDVLPISIHLCFHDNLRVQQRGELWCRARVVNLPLFEKQRGYLAAGGGRRRVLPVPVQLRGDEHQPLIQGVPQQLQGLQRDRQEVRGKQGQRENKGRDPWRHYRRGMNLTLSVSTGLMKLHSRL